jgi:hypothetical protein
MKDNVVKNQVIAGGKVELIQNGPKFDPRFQAVGEYRGQRYAEKVCRKQDDAQVDFDNLIQKFAVIEASREKTIEDEQVAREYAYVSIDEEASVTVCRVDGVLTEVVKVNVAPTQPAETEADWKELEQVVIDELFPEISAMMAMSATIQRKRAKREAAERKAAEEVAKILAEIEAQMLAGEAAANMF